jgi:CBS domain-containing protein
MHEAARGYSRPARRALWSFSCTGQRAKAGCDCMTDEYDTITLSVRCIEVVDGEGATRRHLRVFCPVESRSLDPRTCSRCDLCVSFPEDVERKDAELRCRTPRRSDPPGTASWFVGADAVSLWLPAGVAACPVLVCARLDAPVGAVVEVLDGHGVGTAVVIDEKSRVLGVVGHSELRAREGTPVLVVVDADVLQVEEGAPLAEVISSMAYRRARRVVLVRNDGTAAGLIGEVDVLHWVAAGGTSW